MSEIEFYKDDNFIFSYSLIEDIAIIHCRVTKWNSRVLRKMYTVFGDFNNRLKDLKITRVTTVTPNPKFVKLFGGVTINRLILDGKEIEVIEWQ